MPQCTSTSPTCVLSVQCRSVTHKHNHTGVSWPAWSSPHFNKSYCASVVTSQRWAWVFFPGHAPRPLPPPTHCQSLLQLFSPVSCHSTPVRSPHQRTPPPACAPADTSRNCQAPKQSCRHKAAYQGATLTPTLHAHHTASARPPAHAHEALPCT